MCCHEGPPDGRPKEDGQNPQNYLLTSGWCILGFTTLYYVYVYIYMCICIYIAWFIQIYDHWVYRTMYIYIIIPKWCILMVFQSHPGATKKHHKRGLPRPSKPSCRAARAARLASRQMSEIAGIH